MSQIDSPNNLRILQFNCGNANYGVARPIFDAADPVTQQIIAIQEPALNKQAQTTYRPRGYTLVYEPNAATKVCFLISEQLDPAHWSHYSYSEYVISVRIRTTQTTIDIINIYSPRTGTGKINAWDDLATAIAAAPQDIIVLGDFNAHHSDWGGAHVANELQADNLLIDMRARNLHLLNQRGCTTWRRGTIESVIDLAFATDLINARLIRYEPREDWAIAQDHIPIDLYIALDPPPPPPRRRFALGKLDTPALKGYIASSAWARADEPLSALQAAIIGGLARFCPKAKPSPKANHSWSPRAAELLAGARRARQEHIRSGSIHDLTAQQTFQNLLKKEIRRNGRAAWRRFVADSTTATDKGLWRLSKWSRSIGKRTLSRMPPLRRAPGESEVESNEQKAELLKERFFPPPPHSQIFQTQFGHRNPQLTMPLRQ
jgi:hypothetical protein